MARIALKREKLVLQIAGGGEQVGFSQRFPILFKHILAHAAS